MILHRFKFLFWKYKEYPQQLQNRKSPAKINITEDTSPDIIIWLWPSIDEKVTTKYSLSIYYIKLKHGQLKAE